MLIFSNFTKVTVTLASEKFKTWGRLNHRSPLLSMPPAKTHILRPFTVRLRGVRPQPKRRIFVVTSSIRAASSRTRRKPWPRFPRRRWDPRRAPHRHVKDGRGRRETSLSIVALHARRAHRPGEEGRWMLAGSMGKVVGLEKLAGFLRPTMPEKGEGRATNGGRGLALSWGRSRPRLLLR